MDCWTTEEYKMRARQTLLPFKWFIDYVRNTEMGTHGMSMADLGCGQGRIGQFCSMMGMYPVTLVDVSGNGLDDTVIHRLNNDSGYFQFKQMSVTEDYGEHYFFFCADVLEHLYPRDVGKAIENIRKNTKRGGVFQVSCISDPFHGEEQHHTIRDAKWWHELISQSFNIINGVTYVEKGKDHSAVFVCEVK